mmetsp:Transcript_5352/g.17579  ORF Transcript_5352/g.17579 Transcript_5352/m.17579 type:complete len:247 (+) Transcript_5352:197-937(+)
MNAMAVMALEWARITSRRAAEEEEDQVFFRLLLPAVVPAIRRGSQMRTVLSTEPLAMRGVSRPRVKHSSAWTAPEWPRKVARQSPLLDQRRKVASLDPLTRRACWSSGSMARTTVTAWRWPSRVADVRPPVQNRIVRSPDADATRQDDAPGGEMSLVVSAVLWELPPLLLLDDDEYADDDDDHGAAAAAASPKPRKTTTEKTWFEWPSSRWAGALASTSQTMTVASREPLTTRLPAVSWTQATAIT